MTPLHSQGIVEHALALYDKVVDIFYKFLINLRHRPDESISDYLSEAHIGRSSAATLPYPHDPDDLMETFH